MTSNILFLCSNSLLFINLILLERQDGIFNKLIIKFDESISENENNKNLIDVADKTGDFYCSEYN